MKLKNFIKDYNTKNLFIGIYENGKPIFPEYADEIVETHGEREVRDSAMCKKNGMNILVIEFEDEQHGGGEDV